MSKASEWARNMEDLRDAVDALTAQRPEFRSGLCVAEMSDNAGEFVRISKTEGRDITIRSEEFLALCRWRLDTFGEPTS